MHRNQIELRPYPSDVQEAPFFSLNSVTLSYGESGAMRTPIPAQGGQQSGDCGQQVMAA
jgi:hypothetical protein